MRQKLTFYFQELYVRMCLNLKELLQSIRKQNKRDPLYYTYIPMEPVSSFENWEPLDQNKLAELDKNYKENVQRWTEKYSR